MAEKDSIGALFKHFKQKNIKDWNPIILEFPYFGPNDKQREIIAGLTNAFAEGGYDFACQLILKLDESLISDITAICRQLDELKTRCRAIAQKKLEHV